MSVQKLNFTNVSAKEPSQRVRPTVATILREKKVVDSRDAIERQELESLMSGGLSPENWRYWMERRKEEEKKQNEDKIEERKLEAKLANERILEIAKQKLQEKRLTAQRLRQEEINLKTQRKLKSLEEMNCARDRVDKIMLDEMKCQISVFKKQKEKVINARQVQKETETLIEKKNKLKEKEDPIVKDKMKKIQASSQVAHRLRQQFGSHHLAEIKGQRPSCTMSDSEAKLRIYLQKNEDAARILESQNRVRAEKMCKKERLNDAIQKISAYHDLMKERQKYKI